MKCDVSQKKVFNEVDFGFQGIQIGLVWSSFKKYKQYKKKFGFQGIQIG
jgi:hypothetical protein